jgi:hypothetical protein
MGDLLKHPLGYKVDPERGLVYGRRWRRPVGRPSGSGYLFLSCGSRFVASNHRVIWEAVHGEIAQGMEINHKNGIKDDNRIENLELVTKSENMKHAYRIGLIDAKGDNNGRRKGKLRRLAEASKPIPCELPNKGRALLGDGK